MNWTGDLELVAHKLVGFVSEIFTSFVQSIPMSFFRRIKCTLFSSPLLLLHRVELVICGVLQPSIQSSLSHIHEVFVCIGCAKGSAWRKFNIGE